MALWRLTMMEAVMSVTSMSLPYGVCTSESLAEGRTGAGSPRADLRKLFLGVN